jgi:hypothetical protein
MNVQNTRFFGALFPNPHLSGSVPDVRSPNKEGREFNPHGLYAVIPAKAGIHCLSYPLYAVPYFPNSQ